MPPSNGDISIRRIRLPDNRHIRQNNLAKNKRISAVKQTETSVPRHRPHHINKQRSILEIMGGDKEITGGTNMFCMNINL